jgi:acetyl esterase/lipase
VAIEAATIGGVAGEWLRPAAGSDATLLYLHGGGYFACSAMTHRPITAGFALRGLNVFSANYRLAPEHPFPAAVEDAVAVYRGLLASGIAPGRLTVAGDSAGGGLTLAMLVSLRDAGAPLPAAAVLFSPWTDLAGTGASVKTNAKRDAMFPGEGMERMSAVYLQGASALDPLASPVYADLRGLPPMLIHAGSYEILLDDSTRVAAAAADVRLRTWPVVPHVWQLFKFLPETRQSMDEAARFLREAASGSPARK